MKLRFEPVPERIAVALAEKPQGLDYIRIGRVNAA